jgi:hypothetical protein
VAKQEIIASSKESTSTTPTGEKPAEKPTSPENSAGKRIMKSKTKSSSLTDEQKRVERNRRLRDWRHAHAEEQRLYHAAWRAKQKGGRPADPASERSGPKIASAATSSQRPKVKPMKKTTSTKAKKAGKA